MSAVPAATVQSTDNLLTYFQDVPWPGEQEGDDVEGTDAGALRVASRDGQRALRWLARWVQSEAHGPVEYFLSCGRSCPVNSLVKRLRLNNNTQAEA